MVSSEDGHKDKFTYIASLLKKYASMNSKPTKETFPELPTMVIWTRFGLALFYGLWVGLAGDHAPGSTPGTSLMLGLNFVTFLPVFYCNTCTYQNAKGVSGTCVSCDVRIFECIALSWCLNCSLTVPLLYSLIYCSL